MEPHIICLHMLIFWHHLENRHWLAQRPDTAFN